MGYLALILTIHIVSSTKYRYVVLQEEIKLDVTVY
ncbi:hypothetical protein BJQ96_03054 [Flavobacterium sp. PL0002]|nr:hypothetical protein [Flavobacterium sp. PL002]